MAENVEKCPLCGYAPCACVVRSSFQAYASDVTSEAEAFRRLEGLFGPEFKPGVDALEMLITHESSPFRMEAEELATLVHRLDERMQETIEIPDQLREAVWRDLNEPASRVISAIDLIASCSAALIRPASSKEEYAWVLDQVLQILAGARYSDVRKLVLHPDHAEGIEPPDTGLEAVEPS